MPVRNNALEALQVRPCYVVLTSELADFRAQQMACTTARTVETKQQPCRRECMLLGKRANNGMSISFSHIRNHKLQQVNLQWKRVFWPEGNCMVRLRLSTKAIKTLKTKVRLFLMSTLNFERSSS